MNANERVAALQAYVKGQPRALKLVRDEPFWRVSIDLGEFVATIQGDTRTASDLTIATKSGEILYGSTIDGAGPGLALYGQAKRALTDVDGLRLDKFDKILGQALAAEAAEKGQAP